MSSHHVLLVPLLTLKSRPVCRGLTGSDVLDVLRLSILHWLYYVETMLLWKSNYARCHSTLFLAETLDGSLRVQVLIIFTLVTTL